ncbi:glucokinase regulatory protein-like isoform X2 [Apostichopus japonicus]|uniref:glucokinase regulatory protein-like isoform X2 n=1 Tax=Stichopus japonicus TaxID=307972 RepID=UPI003AB1CC5A
MEEASTNRVTEGSNPLTWNIDTSNPNDIVSQISKCDLEIFKGWMDHENIFSDRILQALEDTIHKATQVFQNPTKSCLVMSGCGTSGRLGFYVSRDINKFLCRQGGLTACCDYLIAGGDIALLRSTEAQEDDPNLGRKVLDQLCAEKEYVLYIGITCGLSAAYVAGQIDHCLQNLDRFYPVLIGFNPLNQARDNQVENWNQTCASVFNRMQEAQSQNKAAILNPVIGPEPITGSSRMKGGTATKVLLDVIFQVSLHTVMGDTNRSSNNNSSSRGMVKTLLNMYYKVLKDIPDRRQDDIATVISAAGKSLNSNGHLYYLGKDHLGMLGLIDASECPPTYGSDFEDVRGFLQGGFSSWGNKEGDLGNSQNDISIEAFTKHNLLHLTANDTVILVGSSSVKEDDAELFNVWREVKKTAATTVCLATNQSNSQVIDEGVNLQINLQIHWAQLKKYMAEFPASLQQQIKDNLMQISTKQTLNMISTGAHILKGKVYHNYMIDLKLSNNKLFYRGISIIVKLLGVSEDKARNAILRSMYRMDNLTTDQTEAQISQHILNASNIPKVLPVTILLLGIKGCTIERALQTLTEYPAIRTAFQTLSKH